MADMVTGLPGSGEERDGADGAAAFLFGPVDEAAVEILGERLGDRRVPRPLAAA